MPLGRRPRRRTPGTVVVRPFRRVGQDLVRRVERLQALLGGRITRMEIGVVAPHEGEVRLMHRLARGVARNAEDLIGIGGHDCRAPINGAIGGGRCPSATAAWSQAIPAPSSLVDTPESRSPRWRCREPALVPRPTPQRTFGRIWCFAKRLRSRLSPAETSCSWNAHGCPDGRSYDCVPPRPTRSWPMVTSQRC